MSMGFGHHNKILEFQVQSEYITSCQVVTRAIELRDNLKSQLEGVSK